MYYATVGCQGVVNLSKPRVMTVIAFTRFATERREEREEKLERVRCAKEAIEENPDAFRQGKWSRCTQ
jgi:hypothetical protein